MGVGLQLTEVIPEALQHIMEPVATQVLNHIIEELHQEELFKDNIELWSDFRTTSKALDANNNQKLRPNRVRARLNPNVNPATLKWEGQHTAQALGAANALMGNPSGQRTSNRAPWMDGAYGRRYMNVFTDKFFSIELEELIVGSALSMTVDMEFSDQVTATDVLSRLFMYFTNGQMMKYIDIQYDYPMPAQLYRVMSHLWDLRGTMNGDDGKVKDLYSWMNTYSDNAITKLINRNKPGIKELVINKNNFQAWMEIECGQEFPEKLEPAGAKFSFTVNVQYARVNGLTLRYPIAINQKFVNYKMVPMPPSYRQASSSPIIWQNKAVTLAWRALCAERGIWQPVHFPWWDKWILPEDSTVYRSKFRPIWIGAFTIDSPSDPEGETVFDLTDLPGITLSEDILKTIAKAKNAALGVEGQVNVAVFADDFQVEPRQIDDKPRLLDLSDGKTLIIRNRRLYPIYRVIISVNPEYKMDDPRLAPPMDNAREETTDPDTGKVASSKDVHSYE